LTGSDHENGVSIRGTREQGNSFTASQGSHVGVGVVFPHPAPVLAETHVQLPVQRVLNAPVAPHRSPEAPGAHRLAHDVVADLIARLAAAHRVADRHTNPLEPRPAARIGQVIGDVTHIVRPMLDAAVALLFRLVTAHLHSCEVVLHLVEKEIDDALVKGRLVAFDGQHVVGLLLDDLLGDLGLAAHGVDSHHRPGHFQQIEQLGDGSDLVALLRDGHLAQADLVGRRPGADQMEGRFAGRLVEALSQGLAIDGDHLADGDLVQFADPGHQAAIELLGLEGPEDGVEAVM
jgi:hypothetical protein